MVIVYRTSLPTYFIGKNLVKVPNIGMINIVAGERIVPELWQNDVTPRNIAEHIFELCHSSVKREKIKFALAAVKEKLGEPGASERAASIALDMMN
jgi:lipid-A-disaccharide synthase